MTENERKPLIRFKGFIEAWEQRKLINVASITKGQQLNKANMEEYGTYYVLNGGINPSGHTNVYNTLENTISISEGGNSCGYVNFNTEKFWSGGHNYTLFNLKIDTNYLYQNLKYNEPRIMALRVGSGLPNVQKSRLEEVSVSFPENRVEQAKIALVLKDLDSLITLHQRKQN